VNTSIDTEFDHRTDAGGKDLDKYSARLKQHHQALWRKPLPSGEILDVKPMRNGYLGLGAEDRVFALSSDQISNSFRSTKRLQHITSQVSEAELDEFQFLGATVGGTILFPGKQIDRKRTLNQARGMNSQIEDRFDLTLECIRLQYEQSPNPLHSTLDRYWRFFELFETFEAYVAFFLLQDLVQDGAIRFFLPFDEFRRPALPLDVDEYRMYMANGKAFVRARSARMQEWAEDRDRLV
jgi:hypothetical protein